MNRKLIFIPQTDRRIQQMCRVYLVGVNMLFCHQVNCWLMSIEFEEYSDLFAKNNIDGNELLTLDSARIKVRIFYWQKGVK